jgi:hypothetical protein
LQPAPEPTILRGRWQVFCHRYIGKQVIKQIGRQGRYIPVSLFPCLPS